MACSTIIPAAQPRRAWLSPVVLAAAIAAAGLLLPEEPQLQAELCQRSSSVKACQVW